MEFEDDDDDDDDDMFDLLDAPRKDRSLNMRQLLLVGITTNKNTTRSKLRVLLARVRTVYLFRSYS